MKTFKLIKKVLLGILILIALVLIIGFIFERISRSNAENIIPHGAFADVGGHKLHYYKKGNEGPTALTNIKNRLNQKKEIVRATTIN